MDHPGWHRGAREKEEGKATAEDTRNWCERYSCGMTAYLSPWVSYFHAGWYYGLDPYSTRKSISLNNTALRGTKTRPLFMRPG